MTPTLLHHFSEDPNIVRFVPHVPRTNPSHAPAVWAMDAEHAPLYWFPRDCPRITIWPRDAAECAAFHDTFATSSWRLHAAESAWVERIRHAEVYRYDFDPDGFVPWEQATGQWIAEREIVPVAVNPVGDLLEAHAGAGIELRITPSLWPLHDIAIRGEFEFSMVRMHNAQPRS